MHLHTPCILAAAIALNAAWAAAPQFDRVFGSHMVLPHGKNVPVSGTDGALAQAMGHVILKEFHVGKREPMFLDYMKRYTDGPFLVDRKSVV